MPPALSPSPDSCSPLYPIVSLDEAPDGSPTVTWEASPPGVAAGDAVSVALFNYNASLFAFGAASHPFCAYPLEQETAAQLGAEDVYSQVGKRGGHAKKVCTKLGQIFYVGGTRGC